MAVTPATIAVALGRTAPVDGTPEHEQWEMWIADALMLISARLVGDGTRQVESLDDLDQAKLDYVVREAVKAQVLRPDDATQVDVRVDDGSVSRTYRSSAGRVTILDAWWDLLRPEGSESGRGAFSIVPSGGVTSHMPWCAVNLGALYCSCGADLTNYEYPLYEGGVLSGDEY